LSIFFNNLDVYNELQVNGQEVGDSTDNDVGATDYTADAGDDAAASDNPADAPEDYTVPDEGEDQTPEEADQNSPEDGTEGNPEGGDDTPTEDYTDDGGATEGGEASPEGGEGEEGGDDYADDDYGDDSSQSEDEIKALEDELFSKFNDQQISIMTTDLKKQYAKLYDMLENVIERINQAPKEDNYIKAIEYVSNNLSDVKDMLNDYLVYTFSTKSFIENQINYKRFCITVKQINAMIERIYSNKKQ